MFLGFQLQEMINRAAASARLWMTAAQEAAQGGNVKEETDKHQ